MNPIRVCWEIDGYDCEPDGPKELASRARHRLLATRVARRARRAAGWASLWMSASHRRTPLPWRCHSACRSPDDKKQLVGGVHEWSQDSEKGWRLVTAGGSGNIFSGKER